MFYSVYYFPRRALLLCEMFAEFFSVLLDAVRWWGLKTSARIISFGSEESNFHPMPISQKLLFSAAGESALHLGRERTKRGISGCGGGNGRNSWVRILIDATKYQRGRGERCEKLIEARMS